MLLEELRGAIESAPRERLTDLSAALWKGFAAGAVTEEEADALSVLIASRQLIYDENRTNHRARITNSGVHSGNTLADTQNITGAHHPHPGHGQRRKLQRPPERSKSIERRRRLAASGVMPPALASRFTTGELAVLRIVADEHSTRGSCELCIDAIAARAGVSRTKAKQAIREARRLGLIEIRERPHKGARSLTNIVTVIDREWLAWLRRGRNGAGRPSDIPRGKIAAKDPHETRTPPFPGIGGTFRPTTDNRSIQKPLRLAARSESAEGQGRARGVGH